MSVNDGWPHDMGKTTEGLLTEVNYTVYTVVYIIIIIITSWCSC